jgi:hypothetical protein
MDVNISTMKFSSIVGREPLTANAEVATVLDTIPGAADEAVLNNN